MAAGVHPLEFNTDPTLKPPWYKRRQRAQQDMETRARPVRIDTPTTQPKSQYEQIAEDEMFQLGVSTALRIAAEQCDTMIHWMNLKSHINPSRPMMREFFRLLTDNFRDVMDVTEDAKQPYECGMLLWDAERNKVYWKSPKGSEATEP